MAALISLALFVVLMTAISVYGYRRYARPGRVFEQLGEPVAVVSELEKVADTEAQACWFKLIQQLGERVPISAQDAVLTRRELVAAGFRSERALSVFYGIKIVLCVALLILALVFRGDITSNDVLSNVLLVAAALAGYFSPAILSGPLGRQAARGIRLALAGCAGSDGGQRGSRSGTRSGRPVCGARTKAYSSAPERRAGAGESGDPSRQAPRRGLRNLADRTGEREIGKLVAILIQTDKFGTSMAESLRTHSDFMRVRRRQEAEERAGKVGVKLVFPIFFFILPSMLLVAAGPGLLQLFKQLFPLMRSFRG